MPVMAYEEGKAQGGSGGGDGGGGRKLNIVVEGCCHGELPQIYASVQRMEQVA